MTDSHDIDKRAKPSSSDEIISFAEFLESVPPSSLRRVSDLAERRANNRGGYFHELKPPALRLHCTSEHCNGPRFFRLEEKTITALPLDRLQPLYLTYRCSNCKQSQKIFAIAAQADQEGDTSGQCYKLGEHPAFGPTTSSRLIKLIGPDRETFLKGRQCENQGLGVGAFTYYRRVVVNQKNRIIEAIIKVSEKVSAPREIIEALQSAAKETQFTKSLELAKGAIPQALLINGQNPLALLHSALSEGLHDMTDERCLEVAHDVRVVLGELADRLAQALKDEKALNEAINRLASIKEQSA